MTAPKGLTTLLMELPTIDIAGQEVKLQRLGLKHSFIVLGIAKKLLTGDNLQMFLNRDPKKDSELGLKLISDLMEDEESLTGFLAAILGWTKEDVMDPNKLPIQYVPAVAEAFMAHPDLNAFIEQVKSKLTNLRLPALSPDSN